MAVIIALLCAAPWAAGCSPPFPPELLERTDRSPDLAALARDPEGSAGRLVMLGGTIVDVRNQQQATELEVLHRPLDSEGRPEPGDESAGRFLVSVPRFLDAAVFSQGRSVTVIGEVAGMEIRKLGEIEYRYLAVREKALHLWPPYMGPRFSIGIGVSHGF